MKKYEYIKYKIKLILIIIYNYRYRLIKMNISWIPDDKLNFNISECPKKYIDHFGKFHHNINNMYIKWHGGGWNIIKSYKNMKIKSSSFIRHLNNAFDKYPSGHKLPHQYKEFNELNWSYLCENPAIIYLFKYIKNNNIDFNSTFDIILRYNLSNLCCNPNMIKFYTEILQVA